MAHSSGGDSNSDGPTDHDHPNSPPPTDHVPSNPPDPPPVLGGTSTSSNTTRTVPAVVSEASSGGGGRKRRGSGSDAGASSSSGQRAKRKVEAGVPPACAVCRKTFASFPAMFGHLRAHREKPWGRGAYPPPVFEPDWVPRNADEDTPTQQQQQQQRLLQEHVVDALMDAAQETLSKMQQEKGGVVLVEMPNDGTNINRRRGLDVDLNAQPQEEGALVEDDAHMAASQSQDQDKGDADAVLDLNLPAPKDDQNDASAPN